MLRSTLFLALALCTAAPALAQERIRLELNVITENQYTVRGANVFAVESSELTTSIRLSGHINGRPVSESIPPRKQAGEAAGMIEVLSPNKIRIVGSDLNTQVEVDAHVAADGSIYASSRSLSRAMRSLLEPQLSQWRREMNGRVRGNIEVHADDLRCSPRPGGMSCIYGARMVLWVAQ